MIDKYSIVLAGVIGYICLFYLSLQKTILNYSKGLHPNIIKNIALIITSVLLSIYYFKEAIYHLNDKNDKLQKKIKQIGYLSYVVNILLKFHPSITSTFYSYDIFGIIGHSIIVYSTTYNSSSIFGYLFLIGYFIHKTFYYRKFSFLEIFTSLILLINYTGLLIIEYYNTENGNEKHNTIKKQ